MKKLLLILFLQNFATGAAHSQSFTVDDLITLTSVTSKNIDRFMGKKKFSLYDHEVNGNGVVTIFNEKVKRGKKEDPIQRSIELYKKDDTKYYVFHTSSLAEYLEGQKRLIKAGFFYDVNKDFNKEASTLYQKRNIVVEAVKEIKEEAVEYTFLLQEKEIPDISEIKIAEDLLRFTSNEFLLSFFGEKNVTNDLYYFSEKEFKKCSVVFGSTTRQVVFVWNDGNNLNDLEYILVSNVLPTKNTVNSKRVLSNNAWKLENGIHQGMSLKELLKINENDFEIYGSKSDLAYMAIPSANGKIDFHKTAILLNCRGCNDEDIFNRPTVSALDLAKKNLPVFVYDIIIYPVIPEKNLVQVLPK